MSASAVETTGATRLLRRIRGEFSEMPGLRLTARQAQRLWGLESSDCEALLEALIAAGFLKRNRDGTFVRAA
jgi:hypothetical protein